MVKQGYKQTEIGVIPKDWEVVKINSISMPVRGGSPRPAGSPLYFNGNFIPWLTVASLTNISPSKIYVESTETMLTELGSNYSRKLQKDTLIISNSGATLGVAKLLGIECCANDGIAALLDLKMNNKFLVYYINSLTDHLRNNVATGNGQPNLNTDLIGNLQIPFPPLPEQEAIASALSDADAWIESLEQLIAKKRLIKQGAMQTLLTPKDDWEVKKLGEVAIVTGAGVDKKIIDGEKSVILLNYLDVYRRDYIYKDELSHQVTAPNIKIEQCDIRKGDILITPSSELSNDIGITALAMENMPNVVYSYHLYRIRFLEEIDWRFRLYLFKNRFFLNQAEKFAEGSGKRYVISLSKLREFDIAYPKSLSEQERIARILSDMDAELEALEQQLHKARQIKQGMMQELLTGKIRLNYDASDGL